MNETRSLFTAEEETIDQAEATLAEFKGSEGGLYREFCILLKGYKRICKQVGRLIRFSDKQQLRLNHLNTKLDKANEYIRRTFGRYLSDEIVDTLLESPDGLSLGGEKRQVTILMTDLRGFTPIVERLAPEEVVAMMNLYLEVMTEIVMKHQGTIDEIIGDALLCVFGAPVLRDDDPLRAVQCALEMQLAMKTVNQRCRAQGYPELEMGVGVNTGEVVVGNIGSKKRSKYAIVGRPVNLTARIESYTVGGQILISDETRRACGDSLTINEKIEVTLKGIAEPVSLYEVGGMAGKANLTLPIRETEPLRPLARPLPVRIQPFQQKATQAEAFSGVMVKASPTAAEIQSHQRVDEYASLHLSILGEDGSVLVDEIYGKVQANRPEEQNAFQVAFSSIPDKVKGML